MRTSYHLTIVTPYLNVVRLTNLWRGECSAAPHLPCLTLRLYQKLQRIFRGKDNQVRCYILCKQKEIEEFSWKKAKHNLQPTARRNMIRVKGGSVSKQYLGSSVNMFVARAHLLMKRFNGRHAAGLGCVECSNNIQVQEKWFLCSSLAHGG